jgi:hypothetical protein|tara:strand:+ start:589 stop:1185 length:597 start_codon:yes stop_codon:yes gene_type:complete
MKSVTNFIIKPKETRYNNIKKVGDKDLILNTEIFTHQNVSRNAIVLETPTVGCTEVRQGDEVIVHHNVFRRWKDIKNREQNSKSFYKEDMYFVMPDQIFAYKRNDVWRAVKGFSFIQPLENTDKFSMDKEAPLKGVIKHIDPDLMDKDIYLNSLVGFAPNSEYEFIIDGQRLYRVPTNAITIKYEYQGNEKEYNPSWA